MIAIRAAKAATVAAIALFASLVTFGNLTDYNTNFVFVEHVLSMDTIFAFSTIKYRAITNPALVQAAYALIIAIEAATALLCWIGAAALARRLSADAAAFNRAKGFAVAGLTLGFLLWQVGFMSVGGEWFGMWQSQQWNGVPSAFRFLITILAVLIFVAIPIRSSSGEGRHEPPAHTSTLSAAMNASCGISTLPNWRMRFLPSFCFSRSLRLRVTSPP
jgi:predicted small integral membrane protein